MDVAIIGQVRQHRRDQLVARRHGVHAHAHGDGRVVDVEHVAAAVRDAPQLRDAQAPLRNGGLIPVGAVGLVRGDQSLVNGQLAVQVDVLHRHGRARQRQHAFLADRHEDVGVLRRLLHGDHADRGDDRERHILVILQLALHGQQVRAGLGEVQRHLFVLIHHGAGDGFERSVLPDAYLKAGRFYGRIHRRISILQDVLHRHRHGEVLAGGDRPVLGVEPGKVITPVFEDIVVHHHRRGQVVARLHGVDAHAGSDGNVIGVELEVILVFLAPEFGNGKAVGRLHFRGVAGVRPAGEVRVVRCDHRLVIAEGAVLVQVLHRDGRAHQRQLARVADRHVDHRGFRGGGQHRHHAQRRNDRAVHFLCFLSRPVDRHVVPHRAGRGDDIRAGLGEAQLHLAVGVKGLAVQRGKGAVLPEADRDALRIAGRAVAVVHERQGECLARFGDDRLAAEPAVMVGIIGPVRHHRRDKVVALIHRISRYAGGDHLIVEIEQVTAAVRHAPEFGYECAVYLILLRGIAAGAVGLVRGDQRLVVAQLAVRVAVRHGHFRLHQRQHAGVADRHVHVHGVRGLPGHKLLQRGDRQIILRAGRSAVTCLNRFDSRSLAAVIGAQRERENAVGQGNVVFLVGFVFRDQGIQVETGIGGFIGNIGDGHRARVLVHRRGRSLLRREHTKRRAIFLYKSDVVPFVFEAQGRLVGIVVIRLGGELAFRLESLFLRGFFGGLLLGFLGGLFRGLLGGFFRRLLRGFLRGLLRGFLRGLLRGLLRDLFRVFREDGLGRVVKLRGPDARRQQADDHHEHEQP